MGKTNVGSHFAVLAVLLVLTMLVLRALFLGVFPLYDTTEARYAEIARIMHETNNWITPQIDYHQPFWGKPPLHTWLSAASFSMFGVSAFAARLPHFLCGLLVLVLIYQFSRAIKGRESAVLAVLVLTSSIGFVVAMGMVMTDIALLLSLTLAMTSFWKTYALAERRFHGHVFFASLALGMLIKGPVAIVLVGIALGIWSVWQGRLRRALTCLPWVSGMGLFLCLTLPWYLWAEIRTPGFLQYFIVGEHLQRFLVSGWEGDLYGNAHDKPRGSIWLFWLIAAFPWSFFLIGLWFKRALLTKLRDEGACKKQDLNRYLIGWLLSPLVLFTLSGNILIAYVLPGFGAMAVLIGLHGKLSKVTLSAASLTLVLLLTLPLAKTKAWISKTSEIELLGDQPAQYADHPLFYVDKRPFSARFYSRGQARLIQKEDLLETQAQARSGMFIAVETELYAEMSADLTPMCTRLNQTRERLLLFCRGKQ